MEGVTYFKLSDWKMISINLTKFALALAGFIVVLSVLLNHFVQCASIINNHKCHFFNEKNIYVSFVFDISKYHRQSLSLYKTAASVLTLSCDVCHAWPYWFPALVDRHRLRHRWDPCLSLSLPFCLQSWLLIQLLISDQHFTLLVLLLSNSSNRSIHLISVRSNWERFPDGSLTCAA